MAKAGCSIADIAAGMYAFTGVLSALMLRDKTGEGSRVDVSMLESLVEWMGRSEEHTSELQSLMRSSYAVFCLKKKKTVIDTRQTRTSIRPGQDKYEQPYTKSL